MSVPVVSQINSGLQYATSWWEESKTFLQITHLEWNFFCCPKIYQLPCLQFLEKVSFLIAGAAYLDLSRLSERYVKCSNISSPIRGVHPPARDIRRQTGRVDLITCSGASSSRKHFHFADTKPTKPKKLNQQSQKCKYHLASFRKCCTSVMPLWPPRRALDVFPGTEFKLVASWSLPDFT